METNKILNADILDLLFDGRNKEYGAYELRKSYNVRLGRAILLMMGVVVLLFCFGFVSGRVKAKVKPEVTDVTITAIADPTTPPPPLPPPPKLPPQPQLATIRVTPPHIVPDDQVKKDEIPPENDKIDDLKISTETHDGAKDAGLDVAPPLNSGTGNVVEKPKEENDGRPFTKVEIDAMFPGGPEAWLRYLNKNLRFPQEAIDEGLNGTVVVKFIVDKDGTVSDVEVVSGPETGGIRDEVVRVIRKSGKWTPGIQNGRYVKSYKQQPVTFHLDTQ